MKKIVVASKNPIKLEAALSGFNRMMPDEEFTAEGISVESGVREQPSCDEETYRGAYNRAINACKTIPNADFWVGLEGGIEEQESEMKAFAWVVIRSKNGRFGKGKTGTYYLPPKVAELIQQGKELGEANDIVFNKTNSKQVNGAIGLLTNNVIRRSEYYSEAVVFALIPFKNSTFFNLSEPLN